MAKESVWDYPRPPRVETCDATIRVVFAETIIAETSKAWRVLETSHPPVYYLPPDSIRTGTLVPTDRQSVCEWKGAARYYHVVAGKYSAEFAAWSYLQPLPEFAAIADHVAFYAHLMDGCYVNDERVQPQPGNFYGGWITDDLEGPFKGAAGTSGW